MQALRPYDTLLDLVMTKLNIINFDSWVLVLSLLALVFWYNQGFGALEDWHCVLQFGLRLNSMAQLLCLLQHPCNGVCYNVSPTPTSYGDLWLFQRFEILGELNVNLNIH
jgi:hypothetical protein